MSNRKGMSCSDAGKLGAIASAKYQHERLKKNIDSYNENPKKCKHCGAIIPYDLRVNDYCSKSCSASHNNEGRKVSIQQRYERSIKFGGDGHKYVCANCGKLRVRIEDPFCCDACREAYTKNVSGNSIKSVSKVVAGINASKTRWESTKAEIEKSGMFPSNTVTNDTRRPIVRKFLEEKIGHCCAICGESEWNGSPIPLVVDHIDGDSTNHSVGNLRLICYNCDAQTDTFKRRGNRKSTREWRQKYFKKRPSAPMLAQSPQ